MLINVMLIKKDVFKKFGKLIDFYDFLAYTLDLITDINFTLKLYAISNHPVSGYQNMLAQAIHIIHARQIFYVHNCSLPDSEK